MRCDGNPNTPCPRCVNAGVECLFDLVEKRDNSETQSSAGIDSLQEELQILKEQMKKMAQSVQTDETRNPGGSSLPSISGLVSINSGSDLLRCQDSQKDLQEVVLPQPDSYPDTSNVVHNDGTDYSLLPDHRNSVGHGDNADRNNNQPHCAEERARCIDQMTLSAPLTAVHAMTPPATSTSAHHQSIGTPFSNSGLHDSIHSPALSSHALTKSIGPPILPLLDEDVVSRIFPQEAEARNLFALYIGGANPFIPLFDSVADTFDSLRRKSPFCLITILYISLCQADSNMEGEPNEECENRKKAAGQMSRLLATESLFENPARLESVQAMILLAAFAEKVWFAIGHALQMALDLGLDQSMDRLTSGQSCSPSETYTLLQQTRTWLILYHIEREFAFGTCKKPRISNISNSSLRKLHSMNITTSSDIRYISIIELVHLRGSSQLDLESRSINSLSPLRWVDGVERKIREWYNVWDTDLCDEKSDDRADRGADTCSFSRTSLWIQQAFATLSIYCHVLSKLQKDNTAENKSSMDEIMRRTAALSVNLLHFIGKSSSYQWHFKWAPTYSALMLAFLAMLAFQISEKSPELINKAALVLQVAPITRMLQSYPHTERLATHLEQITQSSDSGKTGEVAHGIMSQDVNHNKSQSFSHPGGPVDLFSFDYEGLDLFLAPGYMDNFSID